MNKAPAFQFFARDWLDFRVQRMSFAAQGAYMKLLCFMWMDSSDQCSVIDNNDFLARAIGTSVEQWLSLRTEIQCDADPILEEKNGLLVSARLRHEAAGQRKRRKAQSENGKRSAQRRLNHGSATVQPSHQPKGNSSSSSASSPSTSRKEEEGASPLSLLPDGFAVEEVLATWNDIPGAKAVAAKYLSPGRGIHRRITTLTVQHKQDAREWWGSVFDAVKAQQFFLFSGENPKQWTAKLDWVLGPENLAKVLERRYEDFKPSHSSASGHAVKPSVSRPREVVL
jgi:uncharacterized protein YdaU (DUF1376 family)